MFYKRVKFLVSSIALLALSSNLAFAEMINLKNPGSTSQPATTQGDKIDIIKAQTTTTTTTVTSFDGNLYNTGKPDNGSKGVTIGAAYLTPTNDFGYMYVNNYDYDGSGTVTAYRDPLNSSNMWGGNVNSGYQTSNNRLYENAKNYFISSNGPARKAIANVTIENYNNGKYNVQTSDSGKKFVASTMYVRYTYDIDDGNYRSNPYETSSPILDSSYTSGPYVGMGDYFDETIDVISLGDSGRNKIKNNSSKYLKSLSSLGVSVPANSIVGLTIDDGFVKSNGSYRRETKKAVLEKRFEYRRYIETTTTTIDNPGGYEVVYPVTQTTAKSQVALPDISPTVNISSKTEYIDDKKSAVSQYVFDFNIVTKSTSNSYTNSSSSYTVRTNSDIPNNEPNEYQMDFWHSNVSATFDIVDSSGNSRLYNKKNISLSDKKIYVLPNEIKPNSNGSTSINNCTAKITVNFKNNVRYLSNKSTYKYYYNQDGNSKTFQEVINYIDTKPTGLQIKTDISTHYSTTDPRDELTYTTATTKELSVEASSGIFSITSGDYVNPDVTVDVNPPNALTVLEGGKFDIDIGIDSKDVPIGNSGVDIWLSDFIIDEILIASASGEEIYSEKNIPISPSTPTTIIDKKISNLTAKPTHIGKATVTVKYSYVVNQQKYTKTPIEGSGKLNTDGGYDWEYNITKEPIERITQNGVALNYFNIYSLSGNTVN